MKKLFILSIVMIFLLVLSVNPVFADRGSGHGGRSYSHSYGHGGHGHSGHSYQHGGHGHSNHWYDYGWEAAAIGLGAAVVGSAIINSYPRERVTVVERNTYYHPAPPPPYYDGPSSYYAPSRVWNPGHYIYEGGGHYTYVPGRWEE